MNSPRPRTIMAVDGNSLLHRSYHALESTNLHDAYGRPTWAIKGMLNQLISAATRVRPDAMVIGFDTPGSSVRRDRYPDYKATRSEKKPALVSQLELAESMLRWAGFAVRKPAGFEADDVTATTARLAGENGWNCVIVTSDRDSFAHIAEHSQVLRIINGGVDNSPLLNPMKLHALTGIRAGQYLDYAALRGDASDNLPGVRGIGEKTAAKLLGALGSMEAVWADIDSNSGERVIAAAGKACLTKLTADGAREIFARNIDIMGAVLDIDISIDFAGAGGEGMLPLAADKLTEACTVLNMAATAPALVAAFAGSAAQSLHGEDTRGHAPQYTYTSAGIDDYGPPLEEPYDPEYAEAAVEVPATADGLHRAAALQFF